MPTVAQLGYLIFDTTRLEDWERLGREVIGFDVTGDAHGCLRFRMDERQSRVILRPARAEALGAIGWEVGSVDELAAFEAHLAGLGIAFARGSSEECAVRGVGRFIALADPYGYRNEIFCGAEVTGEPVRTGRPISGFRTGAQGLGHVVLTVDDIEVGSAFYPRALGLRLSDIIRFRPGVNATFFHCNSRHHSLAIAQARPESTRGISHFLVEVNSLEDVGRAYDLCLDRGVPIFLHLGQHTNDRMISFYMVSPSGFRVEYGTGGLQVDDATWTVKTWDSPKLWGHRPSIPNTKE